MGSTIPGDTRTVAKLPDEGSPIGTMTPFVYAIFMVVWVGCWDLFGKVIRRGGGRDSDNSGLEISMAVVADGANDGRMKLVRSKNNLFSGAARREFDRMKTVGKEKSRESGEAMGRVDDDETLLISVLM